MYGFSISYSFNWFLLYTVGSPFCVSGSGSGLSLTLNIEQYEYMSGPEHEAGLKVGDYLIYCQGFNEMLLSKPVWVKQVLCQWLNNIHTGATNLNVYG